MEKSKKPIDFDLGYEMQDDDMDKNVTPSMPVILNQGTPGKASSMSDKKKKSLQVKLNKLINDPMHYQAFNLVLEKIQKKKSENNTIDMVSKNKKIV